MTLYLIITCPRCSKPIAVREGSKTFTCPYCGTRHKLIDEMGRIVFRVHMVVDGRRVPEVLKMIKSGKIELQK